MADYIEIKGKKYDTKDLDFSGRPYPDAKPVTDGVTGAHSTTCDDVFCDCQLLNYEFDMSSLTFTD